MHLLKEMFLEVTLGGFFFDFSIFRSTWKSKNRFSLKNWVICYCKIDNLKKKNKKAARDTW